MAYARQIVELHSGRITVDSKPDEGSRFTVHLKTGANAVPEQVRDRRVGGASADRPKRTEDQEPMEWAQRLQRQLDYRFAEIEQVTNRRLVSRAEGPPSTSQRILVVEDNPEVLEMINLALREQYTILAAQNGLQGLEAAKRERPDVIITDFMMPEMDGLTMLKPLRAGAGSDGHPGHHVDRQGAAGGSAVRSRGRRRRLPGEAVQHRGSWTRRSASCWPSRVVRCRT